MIEDIGCRFSGSVPAGQAESDGIKDFNIIPSRIYEGMNAYVKTGARSFR